MKKVKIAAVVLGVLFGFIFSNSPVVFAADFSDLNNNGIEDESEIEVIVDSNKTLQAGNYLFGNLILTNNATLIAEGNPNATTTFKGVKITATNLTINHGSSINADDKGYGGNGPGSPTDGWGPSYGGTGYGRVVTTTYGSAMYPIDLGSGGVETTFGGGGAVWFVITHAFTNNGSVTASGISGSEYCNYYNYKVKPGSGGSVYVVTDILGGTGIFSASGGNGADYCSPGGGGRIALHYKNNSFSGIVTARGGALSSMWGTWYAGDGTVVFEQTKTTNNIPTLTQSADLDFNDGINPNKGVANKDLLTFRTIYTDAENATPTKMDVVIRNTVDFDTEGYKEQLSLDDNAKVFKGYIVDHETTFVGSGSPTDVITKGESVTATLKRQNIYQATTTVFVYRTDFVGDIFADILFEALDASGAVIGSSEMHIPMDTNDSSKKYIDIGIVASSSIYSVRLTAKETEGVILLIKTFDLGEELPMYIDTETASSTLRNIKFDDGEQYTISSVFPKGHYTYHFEASDDNGALAQGPAAGELSFTTGYSNIMFLPGIEGSRLYAMDNPSCWFINCENQLWEPNRPDDVRKLYLDQNGHSGLDFGIYTRDVIDEVNVSPVVGQKNVYKSFLADLKKWKETDHMINDWEVIPYDWRLSLEDILTSGKKDGDNIFYSRATSSPYVIQELKRLTENSDTGKVTIVSHSNGGLVAKALTKKLGEETSSKLIDQMIFVAVPQVGTPQAIGALLHGYDQGLPFEWFQGILTDEVARTFASTSPMTYNLLPSSQYFNDVHDPVITFDHSAFLADWRGKYGGDAISRGAPLHNFLVDQNRPNLPVTSPIVFPISGSETLLNRSELLHSELDTWAPPSGVAFTEIAGWGEETVKMIVYEEGLKGEYDENGVLQFYPVLQYDVQKVLDGDGTVVVPSALWTGGAGRYWVDLKEYNGSIRISPQKHADILEVPNLRTFIQNLITRNGSTLPLYISNSTPENTNPEKQLHFTLHSPLTLDLYDNLGNHTGISTTTGALEENIPGSRYKTFGELKYISVPARVPLHLSLHGYATGSFTLDMEEVVGDTVTASTTFAGIPSFVGTIATIDVPQGNIASSSPLTIDEDGNGITDYSLAPKLGEVVTPPKYRFDGFLQPINDTAYHPAQSPSIFKGGSTVPVKFQLKKRDGTIMQADTLPLWLAPVQMGAMSASVDESTYSDSATTGSTFKWDGTSQQYIYNWSTKGVTPGYWYRLSAKLNDGKTYSVVVGLR